MLYKVPLLLEPQPEGGYTVTSPLLPELVTEGDTLDEALVNVKDALLAVIEAYEDLGRPLPRNAQIADANGTVWLETVVTTPGLIVTSHVDWRRLVARNCDAEVAVAIESG